MTKLLFWAFVVLCVLADPAFAGEYSNGYYRSDGVFVGPYFRSMPDGDYNNHFGVRGNVNPWTLRPGTSAPTWNDRAPPNWSAYDW
jgi:hypothetical protein